MSPVKTADSLVGATNHSRMIFENKSFRVLLSFSLNFMDSIILSVNEAIAFYTPFDANLRNQKSLRCISLQNPDS